MKLAPLALALACVLPAASCKRDVTADLGKFADKACACTDAACATAAVDELIAFAKKNKSAGGDQKKANEHAQRLGQCAIKAGMAPSDLMAKMKELQSL